MAIDIEIRDAAPDERAALGALHRRSSYVWEEDRPHLDAHPEVLGIEPDAIAEGRVRVAVDAAGRLVGFSTVAGAGARACELDDLFVEPHAMGCGVGRALVEDAARRAQAAGSDVMTVVAHARSIPFYEHVGFVLGEPAQTEFGPAVRLRRPLDPCFGTQPPAGSPGIQ